MWYLYFNVNLKAIYKLAQNCKFTAAGCCHEY